MGGKYKSGRFDREKTVAKVCTAVWRRVYVLAGFLLGGKDGSILAHSKYIFKTYYAGKYGKANISESNRSKKKVIIFMADGRCEVGGLADRFRGMVSCYKISKMLDVDYKINMTSPIDLSNFLMPNDYDWRIGGDEIVYDIKKSAIMYFWWKPSLSENDVLRRLRSMLERKSQIHVSTNINYADREYGKWFDELFKPTKELEGLVRYHLSKLGSDFISATFRFQQLLGDFKEKDYPILPLTEREGLVERCVEHLTEIRNENGGRKVLVTSDSVTFLNRVKNMDFVYTVPDKVAHVDYELGLGKEVYMKSFLDYYLLTHSQCVYLVVDGPMYESCFAHRAALHNNCEYKIKRF